MAQYGATMAQWHIWLDNMRGKDMEKAKRSTKKLENIIPQENIKAYLHIYEKMRNVKYNDSFLTLRDLNIKMDSLLRKANQHGWLNKEEAKEIGETWFKCCNNKFDIDKTKIQAIILNDLFKNEAHAPTNFALHFLVYALYYDLKKYLGRTWHDRYIADFLNEHTEKKYTPGNVKKKLEKHTGQASTILEPLEMFQRYYHGATGKSLLPVDISANAKGFLKYIHQLSMGSAEYKKWADEQRALTKKHRTTRTHK